MSERDFMRGVTSALAFVTVHDQETIWAEIVSAHGPRDLYAQAKRDGQLRIAGFSQYYKRNFGDPAR
jgi:siroheme synthase